MKYEKSCGAVIFRKTKEIEYLIVFNKKKNAKGHWGFPKGHMEKNETELETAKREIAEETGLFPNILKDFRYVSTYSPCEGVTKDVVYFLAEANPCDEVLIQISEIADYKWCNFKNASSLLSFDFSLLEKADNYIEKNLI